MQTNECGHAFWKLHKSYNPRCPNVSCPPRLTFLLLSSGHAILSWSRPRRLSSAARQALRDLTTIVENELSALELPHALKERAHAEAALQESEERFRLIIKGIKDYAITMLDPQR